MRRQERTRQTVRGGTTRSRVVLGGQRIAITKPRARSLQRGELELPTFAWAANADPLDMATMASIAAGVSTRRYGGTLDPLPDLERPLSVSKSSVSRRWALQAAEHFGIDDVIDPRETRSVIVATLERCAPRKLHRRRAAKVHAISPI